jgi:hypothetical protein
MAGGCALNSSGLGWKPAVALVNAAIKNKFGKFLD